MKHATQLEKNSGFRWLVCFVGYRFIKTASGNSPTCARLRRASPYRNLSRADWQAETPSSRRLGKRRGSLTLRALRNPKATPGNSVKVCLVQSKQNVRTFAAKLSSPVPNARTP